MDNLKANQQKTIVITGATSGIGLSLAIELAGDGHNVIAVGRSDTKCRDAEACIKNVFPEANITYLLADLSSISRVKELAYNIRQKVEQSGNKYIDVLVNNAGTVSSWYVSTCDGFELQFAVNHLAPFLLTNELLPLLKLAPEGRVITTSSGSHFKTRINWNDIMLRKRYNCLMAYKQTKLCNVLFSNEFNRKYGSDTNIRAYAVDPGLVNTDIGLKGTTGIVKWVWKKRSNGGITSGEAAETISFLALNQNIKNTEEVYWKNCKPEQPSIYSKNEDYAKRLWEISEKMCGIKS